MPGVTKIVSARRGGSITATSLRRCLTITSRVRTRSSSRLCGLDSTDAAPCLARNWAGVPSSPGATQQAHQLIQVRQLVLHRCCGQHQQITGAEAACASLPDALRGLRSRCASSTITRSQLVSVSLPSSGSRRRGASDAMVTGRSRTPTRVGVDPDRAIVVGNPNFRSSSSRHWSTSPAGNHHQHLVGEPAHAELGQHQPGLDRLAEPHLVGAQACPGRPSAAAPSARPSPWIVERHEPQPRRRKASVEPSAVPRPGRRHRRSRTNRAAAVCHCAAAPAAGGRRTGPRWTCRPRRSCWSCGLPTTWLALDCAGRYRRPPTRPTTHADV